MIMDGMLSNISQRLHEVNTLLATYGQGVLSFEQVLPLVPVLSGFQRHEPSCQGGCLSGKGKPRTTFGLFLFPSFGNEQIPFTRQDAVAGGGL